MAVKFTEEQLENALQDIDDIPGLSADLAARETIITGVYTWSGASIASATELNITGGTGIITDSTTDPAVITRTPVIWAPDATFTISFPDNIGFEYIFVDNTGTIQQQSTVLTPSQLRDNIYLLSVEYEAGVVTEIFLTPRMLQSVGTVLNDFIDFLPDSTKLLGAIVAPVTSQLQGFRTAGSFFVQGGNHFINAKDPNVVPIAADGDSSTPFAFDVLLSDETIDASAVTTFPKERDVAGTPTALTGKRATIHYLFAIGSVNLLQLGQTEYSDAAVAVANASADFFAFDFVEGLEGAILLAQIVIGNDATDFSNPERAQIINTRQGGGGGGSSSPTSEFLDGAFRILNSADDSKQIAMDASAITTATTRTITMPDTDVDLGDIAVNAADIDALASGFRLQDDVDTSTAGLGNITLSGEQTLNGLLTSTSDVMVNEQSTAADNGIYVTAAGAWARRADYDQDAEVSNGDIIIVNNLGSSKHTFRYLLSTPDPITVGVTGLTFSEHDPIDFATTAEVTAGTETAKAISPDALNASAPTMSAANMSSYPAATEILAGILEILTQVEADAGTDDVRALTALKLKNYANDLLNLTAVTTSGDLTVGGNGVFEGQAYSETNTLADAATIATDCDDGNVHEVTLGGNRTLGAPTNLKDGATYIWIISQDGTAPRTLAYNAVFKFPGGVAPILSTGNNEIDILTGVSDGTNIYCTMQKDFS